MENYIYHFNGVAGYLIDEKEMPDLKPLYSVNDIGFYPADKVPAEKIELAQLTYEDVDCGYCGDYDIICDDVVNRENEQCLEYEWVTKRYYDADLAERMLLKNTTSYHQWKSDRTEMEESIIEEATSYYYKDGEKFIERIGDDDYKEYTKDMLKEKLLTEFAEEWHEKWSMYDTTGDSFDGVTEKSVLEEFVDAAIYEIRDFETYLRRRRR